MSRARVLAEAARRLEAAGVPGAAGDARVLLRWASGLSAASFGVSLADSPGEAEVARFADAVAQRAARRPVSQIIGRREFWGRDFIVTPDVLDPRPETETLVADALEQPFARVLDLGTGSGCILLTLLAERPGATGLGVDASAPALAVAARNAGALGLAGRAELREGDWCAGLDGPFDLVVSNPPYIAEAEMADLSPEVREHEPRMALTPGGDGLSPYRRIAAGASPLMAPGARLIVECGPTQAQQIARIFDEAGLKSLRILPDLDGRERCVAAIRA